MPLGPEYIKRRARTLYHAYQAAGRKSHAEIARAPLISGLAGEAGVSIVEAEEALAFSEANVVVVLQKAP